MVKLFYYYGSWLFLAPWLASSTWIWITGILDAKPGETINAVLLFPGELLFGLFGVIPCFPGTLIASTMNHWYITKKMGQSPKNAKLIFINVFVGILYGLICTGTFHGVLIGGVSAFILICVTLRLLNKAGPVK